MSDHERSHRLSVTLAVVLTLGSGAMDAIGFSRLGDVFTSVMTGNLVLLGLSFGRGDASVALHIGAAFVAFVLGVLLAGRMAHRTRDERLWPPGVTRTLVLQLAVVTAFVVGWELAHADPQGHAQVALLAAAAFAMGLQSGAVVAIGIPGLSTTYITGTLTGLLTTVASARAVRWDSAAILLALVAGATASALLLEHAPRLAPVLPLVLLAVVVGVALRSPVLARVEE